MMMTLFRLFYNATESNLRFIYLLWEGSILTCISKAGNLISSSMDLLYILFSQENGQTLEDMAPNC